MYYTFRTVIDNQVKTGDKRKFNLVVKLDGLDLHLPNDLQQTVSELLEFTMTPYTKLQRKLNTEQYWSEVYDNLNQFFHFVGEEGRREMVNSLLIMHSQLNDFIATHNPNDQIDGICLELSNFALELGKVLDQTNQKILMAKRMLEFSLQNGAPRVKSDLGDKTFYTRDKTLTPDEIVEIMTLRLVCLYMSPIFGELMAYAEAIPVFQHKEMLCECVLKAILETSFRDISIRLQTYYRAIVMVYSKDSITDTFSGNTDNAQAYQTYVSLLARDLINMDTARKDGDLMTYIYTTIKLSGMSAHSGAKKQQVYERKPMPDDIDGGENKQAKAETNSIVSTGTFLTKIKIDVVFDRVIDSVRERYEIDETHYRQSCLYFARNPLVPTGISIRLNAVLFGPEFDGGSSIEFFNVDQMNRATALLQLIALAQTGFDLCALVTALPQGENTALMTEIDSRLLNGYSRSNYYLNCKELYETMHRTYNNRWWDDYSRNLITTDIIGTKYHYNVPEYIWAEINQPNRNGNVYTYDEAIYANFCRLLYILSSTRT